MDILTNDGVRLGIQQAIKGSKPERPNIKSNDDFVLHKFGTKENMIADFFTAVRFSGGLRRNIENPREGVWIYTAPDNTRFVMRRSNKEGFPTNEFHIEQPGELTRIKIRYTTQQPLP